MWRLGGQRLAGAGCLEAGSAGAGCAEAVQRGEQQLSEGLERLWSCVPQRSCMGQGYCSYSIKGMHFL